MRLSMVFVRSCQASAAKRQQTDFTAKNNGNGDFEKETSCKKYAYNDVTGSQTFTVVTECWHKSVCQSIFRGVVVVDNTAPTFILPCIKLVSCQLMLAFCIRSSYIVVGSRDKYTVLLLESWCNQLAKS